MEETARLTQLISDYWDIAYAEGREGRDHAEALRRRRAGEGRTS